MSTLSATQLPAQKRAAKLQATLVGVTPVTAVPSNAGCVVTFDLYAKGLAGQPATASLLTTGVPAAFFQLPPYPGLRQTYTLAEGNLTCNFTLTNAQYQSLLGQQLYVLVSCSANNLHYDANTVHFTLTPPVVQPCDGGSHLGAIFERQVYLGEPGPGFKGTPRLTPDSATAIWKTLIDSGQATATDRRIICIAGNNEGRFDTVQAYDGQVLSLGILQKTIRPDLALTKRDQGELNQQLYEFQQAEPALFDCYLGRHGWSLNYKGTSPFRCEVIYTEGGYPYEREELRLKILASTDPPLSKKTSQGRTNYILQAFVLLGQLPEFQAKQVRDAVARVHKVLNKKIYDNITVSDYFKTEVGQALVYDQSVNAPGNVVSSVRAAVQELMGQVKGLQADPATWGANHASYERQLVPIYGLNRDMNRKRERYTEIINGFKTTKL